MTERERLLEEFDDAYFALLMEGVANKEGEQLIALNEMLQDNPEAEVPESVDKRCLETIDRHFAKEQRRIGLRKAGKVLRSLWEFPCFSLRRRLLFQRISGWRR